MTDYISREAAIAYIREQSEECQKAFEELGGESGIYADAYNDLADNFYSIPAADVAPVVRGSGSGKPMVESVQPLTAQAAPKPMANGDRIRAMTDEELAERERRERLYAETRQIADRRAWDETSRTMAYNCGQEANDGQ
jgi:hypothetical protein